MLSPSSSMRAKRQRVERRPHGLREIQKGTGFLRPQGFTGPSSNHVWGPVFFPAICFQAFLWLLKLSLWSVTSLNGSFLQSANPWLRREHMHSVTIYEVSLTSWNSPHLWKWSHSGNIIYWNFRHVWLCTMSDIYSPSSQIIWEVEKIFQGRRKCPLKTTPWETEEISKHSFSSPQNVYL